MTTRTDFGGAYDGRRVFVTGHTGFKGSWLCEWLLSLGAVVAGYALDPPTDPALFVGLGLGDRLAHRVADVRDREFLAAAVAGFRPEVVFHLAAQPLVRYSYAEPHLTYETNVMGTANLLEAVRSCDSVRAVVVVTSDKCYENREWDFAYREEDPLGGHDPYSSSKACAEIVTSAYRRSFFGPSSLVRVATVRAGNVIGGGDWALDRIVPDCVRAFGAGVPAQVRNPTAVRPWQHVLEPLSGYLWLGSRMLLGATDLDDAWNFGPFPGSNLPVSEIADAMVALWPDSSWETPPRDMAGVHEANLLRLDVTRSVDRLGWLPVWPVSTAVGVTTAWYRSFHEGASAVDLTAADIASYRAAAGAAGAAWARVGGDSR